MKSKEHGLVKPFGTQGRVRFSLLGLSAPFPRDKAVMIWRSSSWAMGRRFVGTPLGVPCPFGLTSQQIGNTEHAENTEWMPPQGDQILPDHFADTLNNTTTYPRLQSHPSELDSVVPRLCTTTTSSSE